MTDELPPLPSEAMIDAYLQANDAYWKRTDDLPTPPGKWRTGTVREATRESLRAALAAQAPQPPAQPVAWMLMCEGEPHVRPELHLYRTEAERCAYKFHSPKIVPLYTTPQPQGEDARDAERWRYWRNFWPALCRMEVARFARIDLSRKHVQSPADMDDVTDAAIAATKGER